MAPNKRRKDKVVVVFDEKDRREFLTGFRKRKNERRKKANDELKKKEEGKKRQLRAEKREALQNHIYESDEELDDDLESEGVVIPAASTTHDFGEHTVTISTITDEYMGRDFLSPIEARHRTVTHETQQDVNQDVKPLPNINGKTRDKLNRKFRKKAQKRKMQASNDKKSSKRKPRK